MSVSETMGILADYYVYGIVIGCLLVVSVYLVCSIRLLLSARKEGIDVCMSAMIPVYNIFILIKKVSIRYKRKKALNKAKQKQEQENDVFDEDEEIEL